MLFSTVMASPPVGLKLCVANPIANVAVAPLVSEKTVFAAAVPSKVMVLVTELGTMTAPLPLKYRLLFGLLMTLLRLVVAEIVTFDGRTSVGAVETMKLAETPPMVIPHETSVSDVDGVVSCNLI